MSEKPEALLRRQHADNISVTHMKIRIERLEADNKRLQNLLYDQMGKVFALRAAEQMRKQIAELKHAENERLREALKLALNSHGRMLLSDPPQDPWKVNRVDEVIRELLQEVPR